MLSKTNLVHQNQVTHELLQDLWRYGVEAVRGRQSVNRFFNERPAKTGAYSVIALGKAAGDMMLGAMDSLGDQVQAALVLTKYGHTHEALTQYPQIQCHESSHPVPDENSLVAGQMLIDFIHAIPQEHEVLMLVSGGASSLVEVLVEQCTLADLQTLSEWALQNGLNINEINYMRQQISLIKGGKLCSYFHQQSVQCLYISDVPEDNIHVTASGPLYDEEDIADTISSESKQQVDTFLQATLGAALAAPTKKPRQAQFSHQIVANNRIAKEAVSQRALTQGYDAQIMEQSIDADYQWVAERIAKQLSNSEPGVYIWGGEPTVELPDNPGDGGRNQALALLLACKLKGIPNISVIVGGTDGTDGPTDAAGAVVDGYSYSLALEMGLNPEAVLQAANAYHCLKATGNLFSPGPTGTNVMDLVVAVVD